MCVCVGGGGGTIDTCTRPAPAGVYGGVAVSSSIGSREKHITLDINPSEGSVTAY